MLTCHQKYQVPIGLSARSIQSCLFLPVGNSTLVQLSENTFVAHFILSLGSMAVLSQLTLLGAQRRHGCGGSGGVGQLLLDRGASPVAAPLAVEVTSVVVIIVGRLIVLLEINNHVGVESDLIKYLSKIQGCVLGPKLFLAMGCMKLGEKIAFTCLQWVNKPQINYPISRNL